MAWRISGTAQLVEGSTPYWIVTPTQPQGHAVTPGELAVRIPHPDITVESILMLIAAHFGDIVVERRLVESHNMSIRDGVRVISPYFELPDEMVTFLAEHLSGHIRLGFTILDEMSLVDDSVIDSLRAMGFSVQVFTPVSI